MIGTTVLPSSGTKSLWSSAYMRNPSDHCRMLLRQLVAWALLLALDNAGSSIAARMAMIAMTTSNSISVNARPGRE